MVQGPYFSDIEGQPKALQDTLAVLHESAPLHVLGEALRAKQGSVILTGMGASVAALVPLQGKLFAAGVTPVLIETSELIHHARGLLRPGVPVVAVSQSGRSAETIALLDTQPRDIVVIGVTNDATSPLAVRAHHALITVAGVEATVSCKTYVSALLMLDWLGAQLVGEDLGLVKSELAHSLRVARLRLYA